MNREEIRNANEALTNAILDRMNCPLLAIKLWQCTPKPKEGKEAVYPTLIKGEEEFCHNGKFMNCPAYQRYFNFRFAKLAASSVKEKVAKRKDK
ncbi:MAG: hypothetical protein KIH67_001780 [Candidatus Moranbacteria bacterium]|nr:hypothetical protein [Candidatus Moranbacteria bacterium]